MYSGHVICSMVSIEARRCQTFAVGGHAGERRGGASHSQWAGMWREVRWRQSFTVGGHRDRGGGERSEAWLLMWERGGEAWNKLTINLLGDIVRSSERLENWITLCLLRGRGEGVECALENEEGSVGRRRQRTGLWRAGSWRQQRDY